MRLSCITPVTFALAIGLGRQVSSQDVPPTVAATLAQKGYRGAPIIWVPGKGMVNFAGYVLIETKIDTAEATLLLDTGYSGSLKLNSSVNASGIHLTGARNTSATLYGTNKQSLAIVDRAMIGPALMKGSEAQVSEGDGMGTDGLVGIAAFSTLGAIFDFVNDTVYLLSDSATPSLPFTSRPTGTGTLRDALEAAGHYGTFLSLMEEAGLTPLLQGKASGSVPDSLTWEQFRGLALLEPVVDTMSDGRGRILKLREILTARSRKSGQLTAFVPTDDAFAQLPPDTLHALRADRMRLVRLLRGHVLTDTRLDTMAMRTFVRGAAQPAGSSLWFQVLGDRLDVDRLTSREEGALLGRATVVQPDIAVKTGIAHGINHVLLGPPQPVLVSALAPEGYVSVPLYRRSNGYYVVRGTIDGKPVTLTIDTGAPFPVVIDDVAEERLHVRGEDKSLVVGSVTIPVGSVGKVDMKFSNQADQTKDMPPLDGMIGLETLSQFQAYLDYATPALYLKIAP